MGTIVVLDLMGGVALLLWGLHMALGQKIEAVEKTGILSRSGVASSGGVAYDL